MALALAWRPVGRPARPLARSPCSRLIAMNSAKSFSQHSFSVQKPLAVVPRLGAAERWKPGEGAAELARSARESTRSKSTRRFGEVRHVGQLGAGQPAVGGQIAQIDQQRIARERRKALIGRIAVAGRPQRQHLPDALARADQAVDEVVRPRGPNRRCRAAPGSEVTCSKIPLARVAPFSPRLTRLRGQQRDRKLREQFGRRSAIPSPMSIAGR